MLSSSRSDFPPVYFRATIKKIINQLPEYRVKEDGTYRAGRLVSGCDPSQHVRLAGDLLWRRGGAPEAPHAGQHKGHFEGVRAHVPTGFIGYEDRQRIALGLGGAVPDDTDLGHHMPPRELRGRGGGALVARHAGLDDGGAHVQQHNELPAAFDRGVGTDGDPAQFDHRGKRREHERRSGKGQELLFGVCDHLELSHVRGGAEIDR